MLRSLRKNPRINIEKESKSVALLVRNDQSETINAKLVNISTYGMALRLSGEVVDKSMIQIEIKHKRRTTKVKGQVRWVKKVARNKLGYSIGVEFQEISEKQVLNMSKLVQNILSACSKKDLLKKIAMLYMMGYYAEVDLNISTEYYINRDILHEKSLKKMIELFETAITLIDDDEKVAGLRQLYNQSLD